MQSTNIPEEHINHSQNSLSNMAWGIPWIYPVRIFQVIIAMVVSGLAAYGLSPCLVMRNSWFWPPAVMLTLRFDHGTIFVFSVGLWSAFLTPPFLSLQSVPSDRLVYHIVILAIEGVTMILWFAGFMTLATLSSPNGCNIGNCVALQMVVFSGALEWYVILSLTMIKSMPYPWASGINVNDTNADSRVIRALFVVTTIQHIAVSLQTNRTTTLTWRVPRKIATFRCNLHE